MASTLGNLNPLRYRGYVYDQETGLYHLNSRYYNPNIGRFISADVLISTGQGLLGNNMFAYCRNNPINRIDISGFADTAVEEQFDDDVEVVPSLPDAAGGGGGVQVASAGGSSTGGSGYAVTISSSGIAAVPNPNNEKTETHHIVEQCQVKKSGFSQVDIQGNSNLVNLPYRLHRKISGYYSSKPIDFEGPRVRDGLAGTSFEHQQAYGWELIKQIWEEIYEELDI